MMMNLTTFTILMDSDVQKYATGWSRWNTGKISESREFVHCHDTSGSCQGKTVERFLRKTYNILKSSESYFERVNIHIIQCDEKIQRDVKVTTDEEFEKYMEDVELCGFGGTDFRPVFEYVDGLIRRHEFQDLKGLIYFTDGQGTLPERMPGLSDGVCVRTGRLQHPGGADLGDSVGVGCR